MSANTEMKTLISRQTGEVSLLTAEEEAALVDLWVNHRDIEARNKLIEAHRPMVAAMAHKMTSSGAPFEDLCQEGFFGLMTAADKFQPEKGHRFSSYANWWILSGLQVYARRWSSIVKISGSMEHRKVQRLLSAVMSMVDKEVDYHTIKKISEKASCSVATVEAIYDVMISRGNSLNTTMSHEGGGEEKISQVADENGDIGEASTLHSQQSALIKEALVELRDPRAGYVLTNRLLSVNPATVDTLGAALGISGERVRQIERSALEEIKLFLARKGLGKNALLSQ